MKLGRGKASPEAMESFAADQELADKLPELLERARAAEEELQSASQADVAPEEEHRLGVELDARLTEAMRAAYAAERVAIGPRGYEDRIHRRRKLADPEVKQVTRMAERLLTLRETHRLHGIARVPRRPAA